ncbi:MAG: NADH-quinone oxidoreductase subunit NuoG [Acidimicrobiia bacterium]
MTDTATPASAAATPDHVSLSIDGVAITAEPGELLIKAAQRAGIFIPRFCWHERMKPVGMCRMCLVEIEGVRGLPPACTTPVAEGMVVHFHQDNVAKAHEGVLEFLLVNHPLDCPVCDRGGECPLQDQTVAFGAGESRFLEEKRHWEKPIEISDLVLLDRERCIQCARCTRFADEIAGDPLIQFIERGGHTEVNTFPDEPFSSYYSGNVVQICPVGALTSANYRFKARPWDLQHSETTCDGCAVGCRGVADSSGNQILRFLGVDSDPVNHGWLCDKGRYGVDFIQSEARLSSPSVKRDGGQTEVSWPAALDAAASLIRKAVELHGPESVAMVGGADLTNEDLFAWKRFIETQIGSTLIAADCGDGLPADFYAGTVRATIDDLDRAKAIVMLAPDPKEELPVLALRIRRAATELRVPLIEISAVRSGISADATVVTYSPGEASVAAARVAAALSGTVTDADPLHAIGKTVGERSGSIVVVAGRPSIAEGVDAPLAALGQLVALPDVKVLPALRESNAMGAIEIGLHGPTGAEDIFTRAQRGHVQVLITLGSTLELNVRDRRALSGALSNAGAVIAVGAFASEIATRADVVLPTTVWGEQRGSITNLEGRVQPVAARVSAVLPVLDPWRIANELARRCGGSHLETDVTEITDAIAAGVLRFAGITCDVLARARNGVLIPFDPARTEWRSAQTGVATPTWEPIAPAPLEGGAELPVEVPTASAEPATATSAFVPPTAPTVPPRDGYALRVVSHHPLYDGAPRVAASAGIANLARTPELRIHPKEMARLGVVDGADVRVTSARATVVLPVVSDPRVELGVASIPAGVAGSGVSDLVDVNDVVTDVRLESRA